MIELAALEFEYAENTGKEITFSVETKCFDDRKLNDIISFCAVGTESMEEALAELTLYYNRTCPRSFRGSFIHEFDTWRTLEPKNVTNGYPRGMYLWKYKDVKFDKQDYLNDLWAFSTLHHANTILLESEDFILHDQFYLHHLIQQAWELHGISIELLMGHNEWIYEDFYDYVEVLTEFAVQFASEGPKRVEYPKKQPYLPSEAHLSFSVAPRGAGDELTTRWSLWSAMLLLFTTAVSRLLAAL
eukprot:GEZU01039022.1.p1 GENE.GEZU01039022.1~~GEZU01039022.1.p1  ORF type:complete len:286 (+),score=46.69 GEZU01039022.1:128-859(+)